MKRILALTVFLAGCATFPTPNYSVSASLNDNNNRHITSTNKTTNIADTIVLEKDEKRAKLTVTPQLTNFLVEVNYAEKNLKITTVTALGTELNVPEFATVHQYKTATVKRGEPAKLMFGDVALNIRID